MKIKFSRGVKSSLFTLDIKAKGDFFLVSFLSLFYYAINFLSFDEVAFACYSVNISYCSNILIFSFEALLLARYVSSKATEEQISVSDKSIFESSSFTPLESLTSTVMSGVFYCTKS